MITHVSDFQYDKGQGQIYLNQTVRIIMPATADMTLTICQANILGVSGSY